MSEDGKEFLLKLAELIKTRHDVSTSVADVNFQIGKALNERYNGSGEQKLPGIAIALTKNGAPTAAEFLIDAYKVYKAFGSEEAFQQYKKNRRYFTWYDLVKECVKPPLGNTKDAVAYWENFLRKAEGVQEQIDFIVEHFDMLPDAVKPQAEGLLAAVGYNQSASLTTGRNVSSVLHTGDIHFDDNDLLPDVIKSANYLIKEAVKAKPDLIVVSGDTVNTKLNHDSLALRAAVEFVISLARIAPVFILRGTLSHDGMSVKLFESLETVHRVYVSETIEQVALKNGRFYPISQYEEGIDALIYSLPPVTKAGILANIGSDTVDANCKVQELLCEVFQMWGAYSDCARVDGVMTILSGHGTLTGSVTSTGQQMIGRDIEFGHSDIKMANADVVCLAHIHKAQSYGNVFYSGSIAKLNVGETEDKGFWLHTKIDKGLKSKFIIIPTRDIIRKDFNGVPDVSELPDVTSGATVRITYRVNEEDVHTVDEQAIKDALIAKGASEVRVERSIIPKQEVRAAGISAMQSLTEKFTKSCELGGITLTESLIEKAGGLLNSFELSCLELGIEPPKKKK